jgi:hypothetical protein
MAPGPNLPFALRKGKMAQAISHVVTVLKRYLSMSKTELIKQLRKTADVLEPLTKSAMPGAKIWDGNSYVAVDANAKPKTPEPYALAWWFTLRSIADLIEAQDSPLTERQIARLEKMLFGGMGSLNDLSFWDAPLINGRLNEKRKDLFACFTS